MFCNSDSWDSAICRSPEPCSRLLVTETFYFQYGPFPLYTRVRGKRVLRTSPLRSSTKFVRMLMIRTNGALRPGCHRSGRGLHFLCLVPRRPTGGEWFVTNDGIEHSSSRPLALGVR